MAATLPTGKNIKDGSIQRVDIDTTTTGQAVITKAVQGTAMTLTSTGVDAGTGDVTFNLNTATDLNLTAAQHVKITNATTAGGDPILTLDHESTGIPAAGFGGGIDMFLEDSTTASVSAAGIYWVWTNAGHGSQAAALEFQLATGGAAKTAMCRMYGSGGMSLGSGYATDPGAGIFNATTGFRVNNAATAGNVLRGNGTNFVPAQLGYVDLSGYGKVQFNSNGTLQTGITADTYVTGSGFTITAGDVTNGTVYHVLLYLTKSAAGTTTGVLSFRMGTNGTTADTAQFTANLGTPSAVADTGLWDIYIIFTSGGLTTNAQFFSTFVHNITGGLNTTNGGVVTVGNFSAITAFNSSSFTKIGISWNPGSGSTHSMGVVRAEILRP